MEWRFEADRIRLARESRDLSQGELAEKLGVQGHQVSAWENGQGLNMTSFEKLLNALTIKPLFFFVQSAKNGNISTTDGK